MAFWLAPVGAAQVFAPLKRFDPAYWTVVFPRPMMASAVSVGADTLRVEAVFYRRDDLAGIVWEAEDRHDHPLLRYGTARDFRRCRLSFRWRSQGVRALDAVHGPTLTIEGRDADGAPRTWYVRLWNYAAGTPEDAQIAIDFAALSGGWEGGDPVWTGDVDRMFISLVAPGFDETDGPLPSPAEGWAELSGIVCEGSGSLLETGDAVVPEHSLRMATGYDDLTHLTPERVLHNILRLGYRGPINHYVGMSHYFRLGPDDRVQDGTALNEPCARWHRDFAERAKALGYIIIWSLSYELLDRHCPEDWKQRALDGSPGLTGWDPPSALLSPAHPGAMSWLQGIARAFAEIGNAAGMDVLFQVGEPWWWVTPDGRICLYDAAAQAAFAPVPIVHVEQPMSDAQQATLDAAGAVLAASTSALCAAVRAVAPDARTLLLVYLPSVLDTAAPEVKRANVPLGWAAPAFDVLQLEDYGWVTSGRHGGTRRGVAEAGARLGYPVAEQHYLAGFVLRPEERAQWCDIALAVEGARARGTAEVFVWALPQVLRDGFTWFDMEDDVADAFHDVRFPVAIGREASVEPAFATTVVTTASGAEQRNAEWADARLRFDAGPGVRSEAELETLIGFFRARRGAASAFRFEDPFDHLSCRLGELPGPADQLIGSGDGARTDFPLVKHYGPQVRQITRPVPGSVRVSVDGAERLTGWTLEAGGTVSFDAPPPPGAAVRAGFRFDVPVRFAEDRLAVSRATFRAGEAASVPLIEVRE